MWMQCYITRDNYINSKLGKETYVSTIDHWIGLKQRPDQLPSPTPESFGDAEYVSRSTSETWTLLVGLFAKWLSQFIFSTYKQVIWQSTRTIISQFHLNLVLHLLNCLLLHIDGYENQMPYSKIFWNLGEEILYHYCFHPT